MRSPQPRKLAGQPLGVQAGLQDACLGRMASQGQGRLNKLGPRGGLWELRQGRRVLGTPPGGDEPEQDLEDKQAQRNEAPRAWRSQRWDLPEAQTCCGPDVSPGQPRSPLCALGRTMNLSPPTLPLPGDPPASRSSTADIPSGRRKTLSPPDYTDGLAINALSAGHRTA